MGQAGADYRVSRSREIGSARLDAAVEHEEAALGLGVARHAEGGLGHGARGEYDAEADAFGHPVHLALEAGDSAYELRHLA